MRFNGKRAVITGGSSGIGAALAEVLAARGASLALLARRRDRLEDIAARLQGSGTVVPIPCDVTRPVEVADAIAEADRALGGVDMLVNNAGVSAYGSAENMSAADLQRLLDVNLFGPWHAMRATIPRMRRDGGGIIVNIASVAALHGPPYLAGYAASKAALAALTQSLRSELAIAGIRLVAVYPGYTRTEIFEKEQWFGGARRPVTPYADVRRVAGRITRGLERGTDELVISVEGRGLRLMTRFLPVAIPSVMQHIAARLREPEVHHV